LCLFKKKKIKLFGYLFATVYFILTNLINQIKKEFLSKENEELGFDSELQLKIGKNLSKFEYMQTLVVEVIIIFFSILSIKFISFFDLI
jgi:hypothetical protein